MGINLNSKKNSIILPVILFVVFVVYTFIVSHVDIQPVGPLQSKVGMASLNIFFANSIGIHMIWYDITNILGFFSLVVAAFFGFIGVFQLVTRKSLLKVDRDIIILGCFYVLVLACYVMFDKFPINYRPVMLEGTLEPSYPSSHTMLSICILSTAIMQLKWKMRDAHVANLTSIILAVIMVIIVVGRLISGVHWFTDIVGGVLLSALLVSLYLWFVKEAYRVGDSAAAAPGNKEPKERERRPKQKRSEKFNEKYNK